MLDDIDWNEKPTVNEAATELMAANRRKWQAETDIEYWGRKLIEALERAACVNMQEAIENERDMPTL